MIDPKSLKRCIYEKFLSIVHSSLLKQTLFSRKGLVWSLLLLPELRDFELTSYHRSHYELIEKYPETLEQNYDVSVERQ